MANAGAATLVAKEAKSLWDEDMCPSKAKGSGGLLARAWTYATDELYECMGIYTFGTAFFNH